MVTEIDTAIQGRSMSVRILTGDCRDVLRTLPDESVHCVVTSPPYFGLRDYGVAGQIGLEPSPEAFVREIVALFEDVRRVLRSDGTLWLNLGDSYAGSWGAQGRQGASGQMATRSVVQARSISAHPQKITQAGSMKNMPGLKAKDLIGIPWRVAFALQAAGWWLRQDIIWSKPNPMPESVTDRCTKAHEYLFLMAKSERYYFDAAAIAEAAITDDQRRPFAPGQVDERGNGHDRGGGMPRGTVAQHKQAALGRNLTTSSLGSNEPFPRRNKRSVWEVCTAPFSEAHFATFPPTLIEPCILAGCPKGGTVLDPFGGAGTTGLVADRLGRDAILIELNPAYADMARNRIHGDCPMFTEVA